MLFEANFMISCSLGKPIFIKSTDLHVKNVNLDLCCLQNYNNNFFIISLNVGGCKNNVNRNNGKYLNHPRGDGFSVKGENYQDHED